MAGSPCPFTDVPIQAGVFDPLGRRSKAMAKPKAAANNDASEAAADVENVAAAEPSPWVDMDDVSDTMAASPEQDEEVLPSLAESSGPRSLARGMLIKEAVSRYGEEWEATRPGIRRYTLHGNEAVRQRYSRIEPRLQDRPCSRSGDKFRVFLKMTDILIQIMYFLLTHAADWENYDRDGFCWHNCCCCRVIVWRT